MNQLPKFTMDCNDFSIYIFKDRTLFAKYYEWERSGWFGFAVTVDDQFPFNEGKPFKDRNEALSHIKDLFGCTENER